jgi:hypothetical protein
LESLFNKFFLDHTLDQKEENSKKLEEEERAEDMLHNLRLKDIVIDIKIRYNRIINFNILYFIL